jgi:shikimate kinase
MKNIALIGYRGTGKTTVGRLLAEHLDWEFVDSDVEIESRAGCSIATIFADSSEAVFRDLEAEVVRDLARRGQLVLSLGGGAVLRESSREILAQQTFVVWLTATPETIHERMSTDASTASRRPSLTQLSGLEEIRTLLAARLPVYQSAAHCEVATEGRTPEEICAEIKRQL